MCYAFMGSGSEDYNRNRSVESVCIICRMDVVARVDRRFDSSTISCWLVAMADMAVLAV